MEKNFVLNVADKKYLVVDMIENNGITYYSCVEMVGDELSSNYSLFKRLFEDGEDTLTLIDDEHELASVLEILSHNVLEDYSKILPQAGTVLELRDREFVILAYIPYQNDLYVVLMTEDEPYEAMIGKIVDDVEGDTMSIQNASDTDEANVVMQIYRAVYSKID